MKLKNNRFLKIGLIALIILTFGVSFAYFSDRTSTAGDALTGNVDISLDGTNIAFSDTYESALVVDVGSVTDFNFDVVNNGNASVDVVTTIVMDVSNMLSAGIPSDFDIYYSKDVTVTNGTYTIKEGAVPVGERVFAEDGKSITYTLPTEVLSGHNSFEEKQVEWKHELGAIIPNSEYNKLSEADKDRYTKISDTKNYDLVFIFNAESMIDITDIKFTVHAEATQHRLGQAWNDSEELEKYGKTNVTIIPEPSVKIEKTSDKTTYYPGETIRYKITVTNTGNVPLNRVVVTEKLKGGYFLEQDGITIDGLNATIETIPVDGSVILTFLYEIPENNSTPEVTTGNLLITVYTDGENYAVNGEYTEGYVMLPNVSVIVSNETDRYEVTTSEDGTILLENLAPGTYHVITDWDYEHLMFNEDGYFEVVVGETTEVEFELRVWPD